MCLKGVLAVAARGRNGGLVDGGLLRVVGAVVGHGGLVLCRGSFMVLGCLDLWFWVRICGRTGRTVSGSRDVSPCFSVVLRCAKASSALLSWTGQAVRFRISGWSQVQVWFAMGMGCSVDVVDVGGRKEGLNGRWWCFVLVRTSATSLQSGKQQSSQQVKQAGWYGNGRLLAQAQGTWDGELRQVEASPAGRECGLSLTSLGVGRRFRAKEGSCLAAAAA